MKCTNPIKCDGETKPITASDNGKPYLECMKCGFRIPAPKVAPKAASVPEPTNKENN